MNTHQASGGQISAADLPQYMTNGHVYRLYGENGEVGAAMLMPAGCDQQGRYQTRPVPAEACTEVGHDEGDDFGIFIGLKNAALMTACIAAIAYGAHMLAVLLG